MDFSNMSGDEIVITGIAGKFPNSENVKIFQKNLLTMVDCVTDDEPRWICDHPMIPERIGKIKNINKFDPLSFGIHPKFADYMDPLQRLMIESAYEAVADAGINPRQIRGRNTIVFTASSLSETEKTIFTLGDLSGFTLLGGARAMLANRISFSLGLQGSSINIDSACTGSGTALQKAYIAIKNGQADSAIVGGGNIVLHPHTSLQLFNLGLLSLDGVTRSFDEAANGNTRSEGIAVLFLQRARDAKRIYAEVKNAHSMNGLAIDRLSVYYPTCEFQMKVMKQTLDESGLLGIDMSFVEADGSGIKDADAEEIKAIDKIFNEDRKTPLLIGSVKSNVGSCSAANTLISIIKVITMMETGYIPPNLHYKNPSEKIPTLKDGRIKVVTKPTPWKDDYAAVNTTSIGGGCASIILKSYKKEKINRGQPDDDLPRLVTVSGNNEEAVAVILDDLESRPVDVEMLQLLNDIFEVENPIHLYRGYTVLPARGIVTSQLREIQYTSGEKKQIWFIFSGMGSQWVGMGEAFMKLPVFPETVRKCDAVLKPYGIDIVRILTDKDPKMFDDIINSFVGIATIQIGLVDLLTYFGIKPDFVIGHSVGELGCAYADGCFTAEQMVLSALSRGMASLESNLQRGSMAAVGLGYEDVKPLCPPDIDVACHNSSESSTISGPADSIKEFVANLQAKDIFAKELASSNIAFHSRYIAPAGQKLKDYLQKVIPTPKPRTNRWVSTSVPKNEWGTAKARLSSAEYHTNNLLSPVLFSETARMIPPNAIAIEIAPYGLLQSIVKKSLPKTVINIPLAKRGHRNNVEILMAAFGKLHNAGYKVDLTKLYPKVNYPVSRGTASISSLIRWDHSRDWITQFFKKPKESKQGEVKFKIDLNSESWQFLKGNRIGDKIFLPCSLYLKLAWSVVHEVCDKVEVPMVFEKVVVHKTQYINEEDEVFELLVVVLKGSGAFEVNYNETLLCSGILRKMDIIGQENIKIANQIAEDTVELTSSDIYSELLMRGFQYSNAFRSIHKSNANGTYGYLFSQEDWLIFLDGMFQMFILGNDLKTVQLPLKILKIIIHHNQFRENSQYSRMTPILIDRQLSVVSSGGLEIQGIQLMTLKRDSPKCLLNIEEIKFIPNSDETLSSQTELASIVLQLLIENNVAGNIIQLIKNEFNNIERMQKKWEQILKDIPKAEFTVDVVSTSSLEKNDSKSNRAALLVFPDAKTFKKTNLLNVVKEGDFLLSFVDSQEENIVLNSVDSLDFGIVLKRRLSQKQLATLFRKKRVLKNTCVLEITNEDVFLNNEIKEKINSQEYDRVILSNRMENSTNQIEIIELFSADLNRRKIKFFDILDSKTPKLSLENPLYQSQLQLDLNFNVLTSDRKWGTRRCIPIVRKRRQAANWKASQIRLGDLMSIDWVEEQCHDNADGSKIVKVEYSAINETDLILATGEVTSDLTNGRHDIEKFKLEMKTFGLEYSGIDSKGTNVMGLSRSGTLSSFTKLDSEFTWAVPKSWSLEEAATVPLAYVSIYKALYLNAEIQKRESIFIYDGTCPFGQAAINLALNEECEVFMTYNTKEDREFLKNRYPFINQDHIFSSKDQFQDLILLASKGEGVDLVIYNSGNLRKLESCLMCVRSKARIILVGNLRGSFSKSVGLEIFLKEVSLYSIIPKNLVHGEINMKKNIASLVKDGLEKGVVKPISSKVYCEDELRNAFVDGSEKIGYGKIVVKVQPKDSSNGVSVIPHFSCSNKGSYLIIDDLTNFGLKLIDFLIARGAKDFLIASATKNSKTLFNYYNKNWQDCGAQVILREDLDFSEQQNAQMLLREASKLNQIDAIFDLQRIEESSKRTSTSKYLFTKFLHEESKKLCADLRQFVVFSTSKDNDENLNNLLLKEINLVKLCEERSKSGSPALLILWGPMEGRPRTKSIAENKISLLSINECMEELDNLIGLDSHIVIVFRDKSVRNRNLQQKTSKTKIEQEKSEQELFLEYLHTSEISSLSKSL